jgi:hypothetical protein
MPSFTTRIELHGTTTNDYKRLHVAMEKRGFSRTITSKKGTTYHLPTAEYDRSDPDLTRKKVLGEAKIAASAVTETFSVLVTESNKRAWDAFPKA